MIGYCHIDHRTEDMSAWLSINIGEKSARGKGIGTEVLNLIIDRARYENKDISLDVFEKNEAKKLYERVGFKNRYTNMVIKVNDNIEYKER